MKPCILIALLLVAGCDSVTPEPPKTRCINGRLHVQWGDVWAEADGHNYIGRRDGPIPCAEPEVKP